MLLALLVVLFPISAYAVNDTIIIRNDESTELIERDLDSLLNNWFMTMSVDRNDLTAADSIIS